MSNRTLPIRPGTLRRRLTLTGLGALLIAAILLAAPSPQAVAHLTVMVMLSGVIAFTITITTLWCAEWVMERR